MGHRSETPGVLAAAATTRLVVSKNKHFLRAAQDIVETSEGSEVDISVKNYYRACLKILMRDNNLSLLQ